MESSYDSIIEILIQLHLECGHIVIFLKEKVMTHILSSIHTEKEPIGEMKNDCFFLAPQLIVHCISRFFL